MSNTVKTGMAKANGRDVYDLDAAIAEVSHAPFRFKFSGREWSLPHMDDLSVWPLVESADRGDLAAAMAIFEIAFGDDWDEFHAKPMNRGGLNDLFERYLKHSGVDMGESPASTA